MIFLFLRVKKLFVVEVFERRLTRRFSYNSPGKEGHEEERGLHRYRDKFTASLKEKFEPVIMKFSPVLETLLLEKTIGVK